ncbi:energy transducer TonB [Aurantibacillus circumpalustris]|uniref:energy transducer TonB n=1 Tax=Aurantibacillus circumpalustris TaxID=3036359 RepID=UPI00295B7EDA|nr:energy transducer TonB [Aurantibacillus circumpalustris]
MKHVAIFIFLSFSLLTAAQNPFGEKPKPKPAQQEEIHSDIEKMPQFPGGPEAMQKYLEDNLAQPAVIRGICSSRKLIIAFVVEKDGSLSQVDIVKSIEGCPDFDFDVLRVVKNMPKWDPGFLNGYQVRCYYKMPIYIG